MPKEITHAEVIMIAELIREWPKLEPLKWNSICEASQSVLDYVPTRQALNKKPLVKFAYAQKKKQLKAEVARISNVARPKSTLDAMERIARLQDENLALKRELSSMAEVAQRIIYNASIAGMRREKLMAPLPSKSKRHSG
jgi:hypothetical protein